MTIDTPWPIRCPLIILTNILEVRGQSWPWRPPDQWTKTYPEHIMRSPYSSTITFNEGCCSYMSACLGGGSFVISVHNLYVVCVPTQKHYPYGLDRGQGPRGINNLSSFLIFLLSFLSFFWCSLVDFLNCTSTLMRVCLN